jgi:hypothetical protein
MAGKRATLEIGLSTETLILASAMEQSGTTRFTCNIEGNIPARNNCRLVLNNRADLDQTARALQELSKLERSQVSGPLVRPSGFPPTESKSLNERGRWRKDLTSRYREQSLEERPHRGTLRTGLQQQCARRAELHLRQN